MEKVEKRLEIFKKNKKKEKKKKKEIYMKGSSKKAICFKVKEVKGP